MDDLPLPVLDDVLLPLSHLVRDLLPVTELGLGHLGDLFKSETGNMNLEMCGSWCHQIMVE